MRSVMSSGTWSVYLDGDNQASKTWNGGNNRKSENAYSMTHFRSTRTKGYYLFPLYGTPVLAYWGNTGGNTDMPAFSNELLQAYSKLAEAVKGHSFDASVALGEMGQTLDLITGNCEKVLKSYRALRRGDPASCMRNLFGTTGKVPRKLGTKDLADFWIELQYGWKPLLNDAYEASKAIEALRREQKLTYRVRKNTVTNTMGTTAESDWSCTKVAGVALKATFQDSCSALSSLGLTNPASVLWEVTPWSFVVDWWLPIGDFLSTASLLSGMSYRVCISKLLTMDYQNSNHTKSGTNYRYWDGKMTISRCSFTRSVENNPSIPLPSFKTMEKALSLGHLENAAALIRQQIHLSR